jgi:tetratricopeptide (TPR) repeat protein
LANEDCLTVYSNSLQAGPDILFQNFFVSLQNQMEKLFRQIERPETLRKLIKDIVGNGLSYFLPGGGIIRPASDRAFESIRTSYHASKDAERFIKIVKRALQDKTIVFLIDNAQNIQDDGFDIFRTAIAREFHNVRYVLGFVERPHLRITPEDMSDRIRSLGQQIVIERFSSPNEFLVEDLLDAIDVPYSVETVEDLLTKTNRNAHKIVIELQNLTRAEEGNATLNFSPFHRAVVRYLLVAKQPLPTRTIELLLQSDPEIFLPAEILPSQVLDELVQEDLLSETQIRSERVAVDLQAETHPLVEQERSDDVALLTASHRLYRHIAGGSSESSSDELLIALRYKLALRLDPKRSGRFAKELVWKAVRSGSLETARRFLQALPPIEQAETVFDFFVPIAFQISTKDYEDALANLEHPPDPTWRSERLLRILRAVALDRCRKNEAALDEVDRLLEVTLSPEELTIIGAVRVASLMHLGKIEKAQEFFHEFQYRPAGAANYGYFLRNAAAAFAGETALDILDRAEEVFKNVQDHYGALTCMVNAGSVLANRGDLTGARGKYEGAVRGLSEFGMTNFEEVLGNLAYTEMALGDRERSMARLQELLSFASENVPRLYALHHLALLNLCLGRPEASLAAVEKADRLVHLVHVPVAQVRHLVNTSSIRVVLGASPPTPEELLRRLPSSDAPYGNVARKLYDRILPSWQAPTPKTAATVYQPGFLEYWSYNPLHLLPKALLPAETVT